MAKTSISKGVIKDIVIVGIGILAIWIGLQLAFGTLNPFYVVSSGSMIPVLEVNDVLVVSGHVSFEEIQVGDIIVFDRPSGHDKVIVHRVASIIDDDPKTIRTKGDANSASIPGTDFPITDEEYKGKVTYVIPQIGYVTQVLRPPINYVIIAIVIGIMVIKQWTKKEKEDTQKETNKKDTESESSTDLTDLEKINKDDDSSKIEKDVEHKKTTDTKKVEPEEPKEKEDK